MCCGQMCVGHLVMNSDGIRFNQKVWLEGGVPVSAWQRLNRLLFKEPEQRMIFNCGGCRIQ